MYLIIKIIIMKCQSIIKSGQNKGKICNKENCKNHKTKIESNDNNEPKNKCQSIIKTGKNKGNICNVENCKNHKESTLENKPSKCLSKKGLIKFYKLNLKHNKELDEACIEENCKERSSLMDVVSENLIKYALIEKCSLNCMNSVIGGDLLIKKNDKWAKVECKCFTSAGPMSFGPTENWEILIILDALLYKENKFTIYKINLSNMDEAWQNLKITQKKTFKEAIINKKRPHFGFDILKKELDSKHIEVLAENKSLEEIINFSEDSDLNELTKNLSEKCKIEDDKNIVV